MNIDEHIEQAKECAKHHTFDESSMGWRATQLALALEVERLRDQIGKLSEENHALCGIVSNLLNERP